MPGHRLFTAAVTAALLVASAGVSRASVIPKITLAEGAAEADSIIHGRVIDQRSEWKEYDGNRLIFTYSTVRVVSSEKGGYASGARITVRTVGGDVDGYHQTLIGEASLEVNEEVVLFLRNEEDWETPSVVGFYQGKFRVERDAATGEVSLVRHEGQQPGDPEPKVLQRLSLPAFQAEIRAIEEGRAPSVESGRTVHSLTPVN